MTTLPMTLTIAGAAALVNIWIAGRVGQVRRSAKVMIGDGGNELLARRMRAHSNYAEYTPFFLILLAGVELARGAQTWLWGVAIVYMLARLAHMFGMDRPAPNVLRQGGIAVSILALIALAIYALAIPYLDKQEEASITYATVQWESLVPYETIDYARVGI